MVEPSDIERKSRRLETLLAERLGLSRGPLELRSRRARRLLPRQVRRDIEKVAQAGKEAGHPKLARMLDPAPIDAAFTRAEAHLSAISRFDLVLGRVLSILASIGLALIIVFALYLCILNWRGFL